MHIVNRYHQVRILQGYDISLPHILDTKKGTLSLPPKLRELSKSIFTNRGYPKLCFGTPTTGTISANSTTLLNSAYVAGTSGNAVSVKFMPFDNLTLTDLYFYIESYGGTAALVNDLELEVRSGTNTGPGTTGPSLLASTTVNPSSATGWLHWSGLSVALTAGSLYYFIIGDADGGVTNFARIVHQGTYVTSNEQSRYVFWMPYTTTDGFTTGTRGFSLPPCVAVFSNGTVYGWPFGSSSTHNSSGTYQRGLHVLTLSVAIKLFGVTYATSNASISGVNIWTDPNGPAGSPLASSTRSWGATVAGFLFPSPFISLAKATPYRIVFTVGSGTGQPILASIGTGADSNLRAAMPYGGDWYSTQDTSNVWADDTNSLPIMGLLVEDIISSTVSTTTYRSHPVIPTQRSYPTYGTS